ncbi:MIP/aquaporin family protein [Methylovirgula sp. 4M-Z18]|uniref:MIP/aquaporin family protein n=1 Tax=Methylovirgula sp. 4M-Z18 TaxID=2293567 RepID=UPI000E2FD187|nr:MIP/aquaporin family protein [Methylovirgula sp. 4M-Z18]RFB80498.1 aquaporin family protein [Methylovirgula sp. 4M-Z18]
MGVGFLSELLGTMTLILFGDGVVAQVLLNKSKGQNSGWIVITAGWAFAVLCGVLVSVAAGGAGHLNPAVTIAFAVIGGDWSEVVPRIAGEFVGAFLGGVLVWLAYLPHWEETPDQGLKLAVFCTGPAIRNTGANIICEIIGTFALLFVVAAIGSKAVAMPGYLGPFIVALLVWGIGLSLGGPTGYAINPARDLGPRIAHAVLPIAGKGGSDWGYSWIPVVAPVIGGVIGLFVAKATGMM